MQNILVTGGCGFIGANFIRFLFSRSDFSGRIVNVDKLTYAGNPHNLEGLPSGAKDRYVFVKADIGDARVMREVFDTHAIDTICHFAAESHVDRSIVAPDAFVTTNILGTYTLLEQARRCRARLRLFHHISTDEVFGSLGPRGRFTETSPYQPNSPYSASKAAADHLVRAYSRTYNLPVTISNCSNNYGPYQFPEKLIPLMILNALQGQTLPVYGDGRHVRDWLYVTDHCRAVWRIMQKGTRGETYNIGGGCEKTNIEVVESICKAVDRLQPLADGRPCRDLITFVKDRPGHDRRYAIDFSKLQDGLEWRPRESFETGIAKTIQWYLDHRAWVAGVISGEYRHWIEKHYRTDGGA